MPKQGEVKIFGNIGDSFFEEGITAKMVQAEVDALNDADEIRFVVNSPGGNLVEGLGIFNIIARQKAKTITEIAGIAGSVAALFGVAADEVEAGEISSFFIHNTQGLAMGDRNNMAKTADIMGKFDAIMRLAFMKKSGQSEAKISEMMDKETNLTAQEAKDFGFVDRLIEVREGVEPVETKKEDLQQEVQAMLKELSNNSEGFYRLAASAEGILGQVYPFRGADRRIKGCEKIAVSDGQNTFLYTKGEIEMWNKVQAKLGVDSPDEALDKIDDLEDKIKELESSMGDNAVLIAELKTTKESLSVVTAQLKADADRRIADAKSASIARLEALRDEGFILPAEMETYQPIAENDATTFDALEANWRSREPQHKKLTNTIINPSDNEPDPKPKTASEEILVLTNKLKKENGKLTTVQAHLQIRAENPELWKRFEREQYEA